MNKQGSSVNLNWTDIFADRPDLEAPGYQEVVRIISESKKRAEMEKIKAQMQEIQKEKISLKNRNRNKSKRVSSAT